MGRYMNEWVLLIALNLAGQPGAIRDVSLSALGGFTSQGACEAAGQKLAMRAVAVVGRARGQQRIQVNSNVDTPSLNTECVQVTK